MTSPRNYWYGHAKKLEQIIHGMEQERMVLKHRIAELEDEAATLREEYFRAIEVLKKVTEE
jgi:hypothetical protein